MISLYAFLFCIPKINLFAMCTGLMLNNLCASVVGHLACEVDKVYADVVPDHLKALIIDIMPLRKLRLVLCACIVHSTAFTATRYLH
jgi:hypothetical protein